MYPFCDNRLPRVFAWYRPVMTLPVLSDRTADDDKKRRLRAFLTCMDSDTATMCSSVYVPQHLLVMACVLRSVAPQLGGGGCHPLCCGQ